MKTEADVGFFIKKSAKYSGRLRQRSIKKNGLLHSKPTLTFQVLLLEQKLMLAFFIEKLAKHNVRLRQGSIKNKGLLQRKLTLILKSYEIEPEKLAKFIRSNHKLRERKSSIIVR